MKITPRSVVDFFRLLKIPHGPRIFMRHEYDRCNSKLSRLAQIYRRVFLRRPRIVVVIGSLGKTTTKHALHAALDCPDRKFSYSNYGSSLSENLLRIRPRDRFGVLEVGIGGPGQMAPYPKMIRPDVVVVTSIASDHNRSFPSLLDTRAEKVKMISGLPATAIVLLNGDDPHVRWMATQTAAKVFTFGFHPDNDFRAVNFRTLAAGQTTFEVELAGKIFPIESRLSGRHMVYPVLAAMAVAHLEKLELSGVQSRLARLAPADARLEITSLPGGITLLNDSKKGSFESFNGALDAFAQIPATRKIVILGKVEEPVGKVRDLYRNLGERLAGIANLIVCIGDDDLTSVRAGAVKAGLPPAAVHLHGSRVTGAAEFVREKLQPGDLVLVKGASAQKLQRVVLGLLGRDVSCHAKFCDAKVVSCNVCPLLNAPAKVFENCFISRYLKV